MSNKYLFEIRKINVKRKHILYALFAVAIFALLAICRCSQKNNFISKFHTKIENGEEVPVSQYEPMDEPNKGLYGKVNYYLEMAIQGHTNTDISVENLNSLFPALTFSYSLDTARVDYLVSPEEVRLVGFNVDGIETQSDAERDIMKDFYHNSIFKSLIEKQRINLSKKYFLIEWSNDKKRIKSIKINRTLGNVPLLNDNWKGEILLDDPFSKIDTNVVYLIKDSIPLPLFSSNLSIQSFGNRTANGYDTVYLKNWNAKLISEYEQMYKNQTNRKPLDLFIKDRQEHIRFLNTGTQLYIQPYNLNVRVSFNEKDSIINSQDTALLPMVDNMLKIRLMNIEGQKHLDQVIYLSKTPFNIASKLSNNGRAHINKDYVDLFSFQQIMYLESNIKEKDSIKQIELTSNIFLSKILEDAIKKYVVDTLYTNNRWHERDEYQMSVCLMDITTGEVIAAPYYSNIFEKNQLDEVTELRNYNLINHHIGSTFKPLLAFASAAKYPNLAKFRLTSAKFNKDSCSILGYTILPYGKKNDGSENNLFWRGGEYLNRKYFLAHSHDNYPIAMTMLALTEPTEDGNNNRDFAAFNILTATKWDDNPKDSANKKANDLHSLLGDHGIRLRYYPDKPIKERILFNSIESENVDLAESSFANLMSNLYNIKTLTRDTVIDYMDNYTWRLLNTVPRGLSILFPDIVNLRWENVRNFKDFEDLILGQGDSFWNNIKLAEAYARLLSKRKIKATFIKNRDSIERLFENPADLFNYDAPFIQKKTEKDFNDAWDYFMKDWEAAVKNDGGTNKPAYDSFSKAIDNTKHYHFYAKTGTPENNDEISFNKYLNALGRDGNLIPIWYDEGVFVFGIINRDSAQSKGLVGVVYIKHISESDPNGKNGVDSSTARKFLTPDIFKKIMFYNQNRFQ